MLMRWNHHPGFGVFSRPPSLWAVGDLQREMERLFQGFDAAPVFRTASAAQPQLRLRDAGDELRVYAEVPGLRAEDIQVAYDDGVLSVRAQRRTAVPEGYVAQRRERGDASFSQALSLPVRIDVDKIEAQLKNGVLELRLPKQAEARPRSIEVKAG